MSPEKAGPCCLSATICLLLSICVVELCFWKVVARLQMVVLKWSLESISTISRHAILLLSAKEPIAKGISGSNFWLTNYWIAAGTKRSLRLAQGRTSALLFDTNHRIASL